jgi:hypothetical protein
MADSLISKPFSEGAPLDPNALNDLRSDLINTYTKTNVLYNSTESGKNTAYKFVFNSGSEEIDVTELNVPQEIPLDLGTGFSTAAVPQVTATVRTQIAKGQSIQSYVTSSNGANWRVGVISNVKKKVKIDWIAVQKLPA